MNMLDHKKEIIKNLLGYAIVFAVSSFVFSRIIMPGKIPSASMEPTIMTGDVSLCYALAYLKDEPQRGDIIIFSNEMTNNEKYIKRIIGVAGDTIEFIDGYVYINGSKIYEEYIAEGVESNALYTYKVPEDSYFVMGDNREFSIDSREWDNPYVNRRDIEGKVVLNIPMTKLKEAFRK